MGDELGLGHEKRHFRAVFEEENQGIWGWERGKRPKLGRRRGKSDFYTIFAVKVKEVLCQKVKQTLFNSKFFNRFIELFQCDEQLMHKCLGYFVHL